MTTPHIEATTEQVANTVLMPGDPLRAKYIADNYLNRVTQFNSVRNMLGYTGYFLDKRVSVMGSGMGIPSISIYAHELYTQFNVDNIIRIGSCGAVQEQVKLFDIVIGMSASTDSAVNRNRFNGYELAPCCDFEWLQAAVNVVKRMKVPYHVGNVFSADLFYSADRALISLLQRHAILATEMETAGLYGLAASLGKQALAINTVSDHLLTNESLSSMERQESFDIMIEVALQSILSV